MYVAQNALICHIASNTLVPTVIFYTMRDRRTAVLAILCLYVMVRLAAFFITGYVVARRVEHRRVACATIVGILLAIALFSLHVLTGLLFMHGRIGHVALGVRGIGFFVVQISVAALGGWLASLRAPRHDAEPTISEA